MSETGHTGTSIHERDWNSALIQSTLKSLEAQSEWPYVQANREGTKLFIISVKTCIAPNLLELYFCNLLKCCLYVCAETSQDDFMKTQHYVSVYLLCHRFYDLEFSV